MATLEPLAFCSIEKYEERREERILETELSRAAVYAFLVRFEPNPPEAMKLAARTEIAIKAGRTLVNLTVLDQDLNPFLENDGVMSDGLWKPASHDPLKFVHFDDSESLAQEGYFLDYDDGLGMPTVEAAQRIETPQELMGAGF